MNVHRVILRAIKNFLTIPDVCKGCGRRTIAEKRRICPYDRCVVVK